jgi:hypothetical protein
MSREIKEIAKTTAQADLNLLNHKLCLAGKHGNAISYFPLEGGAAWDPDLPLESQVNVDLSKLQLTESDDYLVNTKGEFDKVGLSAQEKSKYAAVAEKDLEAKKKKDLLSNGAEPIKGGKG